MLYLTHWGLRELPFGITPDTSYYYAGACAQAALNTALVAIESGEGYIRITGEVGTGKTLLCRRILGLLRIGAWRTAYIPNPNLGPRGLLLALAQELEAGQASARDEYRLTCDLNRRLIELAQAGQRVLVLIDEAQAMPIVTLEAVRLLGNLETEKRKLLQVLLFGQPELDAKLALPELRQLAQRMSFSHRLTGLSAAETAGYLAHRLLVAGYDGPPVFADAAVDILHAASRGTPRLLNVLAHKTLLCAYGRGVHIVGAREANAAVDDTPTVAPRSWWSRMRHAVGARQAARLAAGTLR